MHGAEGPGQGTLVNAMLCKIAHASCALGRSPRNPSCRACRSRLPPVCRRRAHPVATNLRPEHGQASRSSAARTSPLAPTLPRRSLAYAVSPQWCRRSHHAGQVPLAACFAPHTCSALCSLMCTGSPSRPCPHAARAQITVGCSLADVLDVDQRCSRYQNFPGSSYQAYIHTSKYARWLPDAGRREAWPETVSRYADPRSRALGQIGSILAVLIKSQSCATLCAHSAMSAAFTLSLCCTTEAQPVGAVRRTPRAHIQVL